MRRVVSASAVFSRVDVVTSFDVIVKLSRQTAGPFIVAILYCHTPGAHCMTPEGGGGGALKALNVVGGGGRGTYAI